jgi:putative aminopeptidase FrvX
MHTTVDTVHKKDVENVIRLIYKSVQMIKNGETFSYFDA